MPKLESNKIAKTDQIFDESINISDKNSKNAESKSEIIEREELTAITFGSFKNEVKNIDNQPQEIETKPTSISFVQREERRARKGQKTIDRIKL